MSKLKARYNQEVRDKLVSTFSYSNPMEVPKLLKIVISMGVAHALKDKNALDDAAAELMLISGQKPVRTSAKQSISNFKLREGQPIGLKVTLRGDRMYHFFDRFTNIVCPRIRDFRGFLRKGDSQGNYSLGLTDQQVFPEINLDRVKRDQGMNITFVTSATNDEEGLTLLAELGLPYKKKQRGQHAS